jgi:hypothetical protein
MIIIKKKNANLHTNTPIYLCRLMEGQTKPYTSFRNINLDAMKNGYGAANKQAKLNLNHPIDRWGWWRARSSHTHHLERLIRGKHKTSQISPRARLPQINSLD